MSDIPIDIDEVLGTAYVFLTPEGTAQRVAKTLSVEAYLDLDDDGNVVGIEILDWPVPGRVVTPPAMQTEISKAVQAVYQPEVEEALRQTKLLQTFVEGRQEAGPVTYRFVQHGEGENP